VREAFMERSLHRSASMVVSIEDRRYSLIHR